MAAIDYLNIYPPGTVGFVCVGDRYNRWWIPATIQGRVMGLRRVIDYDGESWFIEHDMQFSLTRPWVGKRTNLYAMSKI